MDLQSRMTCNVTLICKAAPLRWGGSLRNQPAGPQSGGFAREGAALQRIVRFIPWTVKTAAPTGKDRCPMKATLLTGALALIAGVPCLAQDKKNPTEPKD